MDDTDRGILERIRADARATNAAIGSALGLSEGAVRHRIARLVEAGVILRFTAVTRPLGPEGIVLIRCRPGATPNVVARLREVAPDLYETSGEFDLAAAVEAGTMEEFNAALDRLRAIPGVESTTTLIRLTRFVAPARAATPAGGKRSPGPRKAARGCGRGRYRPRAD